VAVGDTNPVLRFPDYAIAEEPSRLAFTTPKNELSGTIKNKRRRSSPVFEAA